MKLSVADLTFLAEDLGKRSPPPLRYLAALTTHPDAVVREGAIYGLSYHLENPQARVLIEKLLNDAHYFIRQLAREALE